MKAQTLLYVLITVSTLLLVQCTRVPTVLAGETIEGVCGVFPVNTKAYVAVELPLKAGGALSGVRWYNNDGTKAFENIIVVEAEGGVAPDLTSGALVLADVGGLSSKWSELYLPVPASSSTGLVQVVFVFDDERRGLGSNGGQGIGYFNSPGEPVYLSSNGTEWTRMNTGYHLAVEPIPTAIGKSSPVLLSSLPSPDLGISSSEEKPTTNSVSVLLETELLPARPNPFNPATEIRYSLAGPSEVRVLIYDARGRLVRGLHPGHQAAGAHSIVWRGQDERGHDVASGVYYLVLEADGMRHRQRLVLVR